MKNLGKALVLIVIGAFVFLIGALAFSLINLLMPGVYQAEQAALTLLHEKKIDARVTEKREIPGAYQVAILPSGGTQRAIITVVKSDDGYEVLRMEPVRGDLERSVFMVPYGRRGLVREFFLKRLDGEPQDKRKEYVADYLGAAITFSGPVLEIHLMDRDGRVGFSIARPRTDDNPDPAQLEVVLDKYQFAESLTVHGDAPVSFFKYFDGTGDRLKAGQSVTVTGAIQGYNKESNRLWIEGAFIHPPDEGRRSIKALLSSETSDGPIVAPDN